MTVHDFKSGPRKRGWILMGALVLCAAALIWHLVPALKTLVSHPAATAENRPVQASPAARTVDGSRPQGAVPSNAMKGQPAAVPEKTAASGRVHSKGTAPSNIGSKRAGNEQRIIPLTSAQPAPAVASPATTTPAPPPATASSKPAAIEQTPAPPASLAKPASFSEAMAMMNLSLLLYSDVPAERIVFINGRKYVEGDHIDGKYLLESITLEGAVLSYQGERAILRPRQKYTEPRR
jgi:general secretion pathway protein B